MHLDDFASRLRRATDIVFFTGAGISTESGIPDFRSPGGTWTRMKPVYFDDFISSEEARVRAWQRKKESHQLYKEVKPNIGHTSISDFEKRGKLLGLITQNIDGLHSRGGVSEDKIVELHGSDRTVVCLGCGKDFDPDEVLESLGEEFTSPRCDACDGLLKSGTISFGQPMPAGGHAAGPGLERRRRRSSSWWARRYRRRSSSWWARRSSCSRPRPSPSSPSRPMRSWPSSTGKPPPSSPWPTTAT